MGKKLEIIKIRIFKSFNNDKLINKLINSLSELFNYYYNLDHKVNKKEIMNTMFR